MNASRVARLGVDAATWSRLSPLLDEALELAPEQRGAWLAGLPAHAADLREPLRRLLDPDAPRLGAPPLTDFPAHHEGEAIGPYRLLAPLGEGGMGEVWLAERADGQLTRQVALKLPHAEALQPGLGARLARERDILAALEHPGIARLYDAGIDAEGRPYLALEYVRGERIDRWCDRHGLDVRARLRLFLQAARAVAYAHAQLIVHRDLKPSNLLVDDSGQVRLLDFGIARMLGDERAAVELTSRGAAAMTPAFASPEQVGGLPVGTASDVYSLGVLLFELLAGTGPYQPSRDTRSALEEAVLSETPRRPSDAAIDRATRGALRGDLDAIVLHALAKVPAQRYATVEAFVDDIERHLQYQPVRARPAGIAYALRKFVRRHRIGVGASAAVAAALVAGSALALWQAQRAEAERQRAEQVKSFVADILRDASPYYGGDVAHMTAVDLVRQAQQRLDDAKLSSPQVRIELANLIGESLLSLSDYDRAEPILDATVDDARLHLGDAHVLTLRARLLRSQMQRLRGRVEAQREELAALLPALRSGVNADPTLPVVGLQHLTLNAIDRGAYGEAERTALDGWNLARSHLGERHAETVASAVLLALAHRYAGHFPQARLQAEHALRMAQQAYPGPGLHPRVVEARSVLGRALADVGELSAGVEQLQAAVNDARQLFGNDTPIVGTLRQNLVAYQIDLGELLAADVNSAEALRLVDLHSDRDSFAHAGTTASRGMVLLASRRDDEALALLTSALERLARLLGTTHDVTTMVAASAALAQARLGRLGDAEARLKALEPSLASPGTAAATRTRAARAWATLELAQGDATAARRRLERMLTLDDPAPRMQRERMRARLVYGQALLALKLPSDARAAFTTARDEVDRLETGLSPNRADAIAGLAKADAALSLAAPPPASAVPQTPTRAGALRR